MRRLVLLAALLTAGAAAADHPGALAGADADRAKELNDRIDAAEKADDYPEAVRLAGELLALRTRVQGAGHWETVSQRFTADAVRAVAALPAGKRGRWQVYMATQKAAEASELAGNYAAAEEGRRTNAEWAAATFGAGHPEAASALSDLGHNLVKQGRLADGTPPLRRAVDAFLKTYGDAHPTTAEARSMLGTALNAAAEHAAAEEQHRAVLATTRAAFGERDTRTAEAHNNLGLTLNRLGKPVLARAEYEQALAAKLDLLGEASLDVAVTRSNLAGVLEQLDAVTEAEGLRRAALATFRRTPGENHPTTATAVSNLAVNLDWQGRLAEAEELGRQALAVRQRVLPKGHPNLAQSHGNLAATLYAQGRYAEAGPLFERAVALYYDRLGDAHPDTAAAYSNLANNRAAEGDTGEAQRLFQKAIDAYRQSLGDAHPATAEALGNAAVNLAAQGRLEEAEGLFRQVVQVYRASFGDDHPKTAAALGNLASVLNLQGRSAEARTVAEKSVAVARTAHGDDHPDTLERTAPVYASLQAEGRHADALPLIEKLLSSRRRRLGPDHPQTARVEYDLGRTLTSAGRLADAETALRHALEVQRRVFGEAHRATAETASALAVCLTAAGRDAGPTLAAAARAFEAARLGVATSGLDRASYGAESSPYALAAVAAAGRGDAVAAWTAAEADLARGLLDDGASRRPARLTPDEEVRRGKLTARRAELQTRILKAATATPPAAADALLAERRQVDDQLADLAVAVGRRELADLDRVRAALPAGAALLLWLDVSAAAGRVQERWGAVVRAGRPPAWERLPGTGPGGRWTDDDDSRAERLRLALADPASPIEATTAAATVLSAQRLAPLQKHLAGVTHLIVVGARHMAGVPVEVLAADRRVSYVPSGSVLARLGGLPPPAGTDALAVGDPMYRPAAPPGPLPPGGLLVLHVVPNGAADAARIRPGDVLLKYAGVSLDSLAKLQTAAAERAAGPAVEVEVWRDGQERTAARTVRPGRLGVAVAADPAPVALADRRRADRVQLALRGEGDLSELPGTAVEVDRLKALFGDRVTALTGPDASVGRLDGLRAGDGLKRFRYLHFAVHGRANRSVAFESALLLSPGAADRPGADGRLTAAEVLAGWALDADLVTLSACETGLGRAGGGDGLLGFAQAFLAAGSRAVALTLWRVDDAATALLMDRLYHNLATRHLPKAAALAEAKTWLRELPADAAAERLAGLSRGVARGAGRPARPPAAPVADASARPFAHPRYWAAFVLVGDPN